MIGLGERCEHGTPKGEFCRGCQHELNRKEIVEVIKESMCPHGTDWRECAECEASGWKPGDRNGGE